MIESEPASRTGAAVLKAWSFLADRRRARLGAALIVVVVCLTRGPVSGFVYDANTYWAGTLALVQGVAPADLVSAGWLVVRGILTPLLYAPAALLDVSVGPPVSTIAVLVENTAVIAIVSVILVPALADQLVGRNPLHVWVSGLIGAILLRGFAPYPLMDVWALALILTALSLTNRGSWRSRLIAGAALGAAVNLRPAYLLPALLLLALQALQRPAHLPAGIAGAVLALAPQVFFNRVVFGVLTPFPPSSFSIAAIQSTYSSYVVRYDTDVLRPPAEAGQFYCDVPAARFTAQLPADGHSGFAALALHEPITFAWLVIEKLSAAMMWSTATPYADTRSTGLTASALLIIVIIALGVAAALTAWRGAAALTRLRLAGPLIVAVASAGTLAASTPETRFALPLIFGVLPIALSGHAAFGRPRSRTAWIGLAVLIAAVSGIMITAGLLGIADPAAPGATTAATCAAAGA